MPAEKRALVVSGGSTPLVISTIEHEVHRLEDVYITLADERWVGRRRCF